MTTHTSPPGPPGPANRHYIGTGERFFRVTAYFIFSVVTGVLMTATNILLHACESLLDLVLHLISVPEQVNTVITTNNLALLDAQDKEEGEGDGAPKTQIDPKTGYAQQSPPVITTQKEINEHN